MVRTAHPTRLLKHPQELHHFSYVINNPINFTDPSGFGLLSAIKCYRLTNKYDELFEECEKECVPPSRNDLPALAEYTYGTFDLNEPIRRCVDKKDPNLVKDILKACSTATLPMPIPRRIK